LEEYLSVVDDEMRESKKEEKEWQVNIYIYIRTETVFIVWEGTSCHLLLNAQCT
jgi:hypothetical protein